MRKDHHLVIGDMYIGLEGMHAAFGCSSERAHRVLRVICFVAAVGDSLR